MSKTMKAVEKLRRAIEKEDVDGVRDILQVQGVAARETCLCELTSGGNALHYAASKGYVDIIAAILKAGVDVNSRREQGDAIKGVTALHEAINELHTEAVHYLLQKGANVNGKDDNGITPMHIACRENAVGLVEELFESGGDINAIDNRGYSPLLVCIIRSAHDCSLFLLNNGAEVQMTDKEGSSPLHYASEWESLPLVEVIVGLGSDVNLQDNDGNTPLHVTADEDVFDFLVQQGADPTLRNNKGRPARDQRLDMDKDDFVNINNALGGHTDKMDHRKSHSARLQQVPINRIFSPGPPIPETELKTARTNMLKELQKCTGYEGAALTPPGQGKVTPRTPRATGTALVSPLAREAVDNLNNHLSKTTISSAK